MKLKIPYYRQKDHYSCGPATLQMVFSFFGKHEKQRKLMKFAGVTKKELRKIGTPNSKMIEAARRAKFYCYVNDGSLLEEAKYYIRLGLPVIVNYTEPSYESGHFAVLSGYSVLTKKLILNDPWNGKNFKISESQFIRRWYSADKNHYRWLMVINKKPFRLGKQFYPTGVHSNK